MTLNEWSTGLDDAVLAHLGIELDKTLQNSDWGAERLTRRQVEYAATDAVMGWRLAQRIFPALGRQTPAYEVQAACVPAVSRMQRRGVLIDLDAHTRLMRALETELAEKREEYRAACLDMGLPALATVPKTPNQIIAALKVMLSSDELAGWKRTEKAGVLSTARADLRRAAHYPPIPPLVRITRINKLLSAFGPALTAMVNPLTQRIHASYRVAGADTGRVTCNGPNLQQTPSPKSGQEFRAVFVAANGCKIIAGDFATMELRAGAHISSDGRMLEAFRNGIDLHKLTASSMLGKSVKDVSEVERSHAKPINFGALFGERARGLIASAWEGLRACPDRG